MCGEGNVAQHVSKARHQDQWFGLGPPRPAALNTPWPSNTLSNEISFFPGSEIGQGHSGARRWAALCQEHLGVDVLAVSAEREAEAGAEDHAEELTLGGLRRGGGEAAWSRRAVSRKVDAAWRRVEQRSCQLRGPGRPPSSLKESAAAEERGLDLAGASSGSKPRP